MPDRPLTDGIGTRETINSTTGQIDVIREIVDVVETDFTAGVYTIASENIGKFFKVDLSASLADRTVKFPDADGTFPDIETGINYFDGSVDLTITTVGGTQLIGSATSQTFTKTAETITVLDDTTAYIISQDSRITKAGVVVLPWNDGVTAVTNLEEETAHYFSSGRLEGGAITTGAGVVNVASAQWYIRNANDDDAPLKPAVVASATGLVIPDNDTSYIIADYNSGTPIHDVAPDITVIPCQAQCISSVVSRVNSNIDVLDIGGYTNDFMAKYTRAEAVTGWMKYGSGLMVSDLGTQNIGITAGSLYNGVNRYVTPDLDTSVAGIFTYYYQSATPGIWTEQASSTQINIADWDDGSGTLASVSTNKFYNHAVYARVNSPSEYAVLYPQVEYNSLAAAQAAAGVQSTVPAFGEAFSTGRFIGTIITKANTVAFADIRSPFIEALFSATPTNHGDLSGLLLAAGGTTYGHIDDQAQTISGIKTFSSNTILSSFTIGGQNITDILISTDGASTSDTALVTPGWIDANISGGAGDVTGPASSTDNAICRFDSTTGKVIQNSSATVDDVGRIYGIRVYGPTIGSWGVGDPAASNQEYVTLHHNGSAAFLQVGETGTGAYRDLIIQTGGSESLKIEVDKTATFAGDLQIGSTTAGAALGVTSDGSFVNKAYNSVGTLVGSVNNAGTSNITVGAAGTIARELKVSGDANNRFQIFGNGTFGWGDGTAATDTNLYRSAANTLRTDDSFIVGAAFTGVANVDAASYSVGATAGASFSGVITNLTVVNGLVTAAS